MAMENMKMAQYSHSGDSGETDLSWARVSKASEEIALLAALDDLDAMLCYWCVELRELRGECSLVKNLELCHSDLVKLMSSVAGYAPFPTKCLARLDDELAKTGALQNFSGFVDFSRSSPLAALGNLCRTRCRIAEQSSAKLGDRAKPWLSYLNRLSSCIFAWAKSIDDPSPAEFKQ